LGELVGGVHVLALLAATQAQTAVLPAGVLTHPFDDKAAMVSAGEEHTLCVTSGGVVYAWGSLSSDLNVGLSTSLLIPFSLFLHGFSSVALCISDSISGVSSRVNTCS